ncbi:MAG: transporter substrate-binding domain-containing protein [Alistipes onderdonkii]
MATNAAFAPFEYMLGDKYAGIDMEIAAALAEYLGMELVIQNMDFESVVTSVGKNGVDIAMAGLTVSDTRKQSVNFSESYYEASQMVLVMKDDATFDECNTAEDVENILKSK